MDWSLYQHLKTIEASLARVEKAVAALSAKRSATRLSFDTDHVQLLNKKGVLIMSGTINCTDDHDLRVPLVWKDDAGKVAAPTSGTVASTDNATVVSAVDVAADDMSVVLRTAGDGMCNITVANGPMTDTIQVVVGPPTATILEVDAVDAVQVVKGTPA
jgi:hypothetical protein